MGVKVAVAVAVAVAIAVAVAVAVAVGVDGTVAVAVAVAATVGVGVGVGDPPGHEPGSERTMLSTRQPESELLVSLPIRHRNTTFCPAAVAGRFTVVVIKPPELPLHAGRPANGLLKPVLIVPV